MSIQITDTTPEEDIIKNRVSFIVDGRKTKREYSVKNVHRCSRKDSKSIKRLIDGLTWKLFGNFDLNEILCQSYLTLVLRNDDNNIISAMSLLNYPNVAAIHPSEWVNWIQNIYRVKDTDSRNTVWVHLLVLITPDKNCIKPLIESIFVRLTNIKYIMMVIPANCWRHLVWLADLGTKILPVKYGNDRTVQTLFMIERSKYVKQYKFRRACEEDNDDLIPLINTHAPQLTELYGNYYIAEIITRHKSSGRNVIVAEYDGHAISVLCINSVVNYTELDDNFQLEPFHGLRKPCSMDLIKSKQVAEVEVKTQTQAELQIIVAERQKRRMKNLYDSNQFLVEDDDYYEDDEGEEDVLEFLMEVQSMPLNNIDMDQSVMSMKGAVGSTSKVELRRRGYEGGSKSFNDDDDSLSDSDDDSDSDSESLVLDMPDASTISSASPMGSEMGMEEGEEEEDSDASYDGGSLGSAYSALALSQSTHDLRVAAIEQQRRSETNLLAAGTALHGPVNLQAVAGNPLRCTHVIHTVDQRDNIYRGEPNAFVLELAASWPSHELALNQLIACCFQCYPDRDYCVMSLPTDTPHFPLLDIMVRVTPRPATIYAQDLYLVHRNALNGIMSVRYANVSDIYSIEDLIYTTPKSYELIWLIRESLHNGINELFLLFCGTDLVGFALIRMEKNYEYLKQYYDIDTYTSAFRHKSGSIGKIEYMMISPIFQRQSQFFLAEVHRLSSYTMMTYYILQQDGDKYRHLSVNLADLIPVKPLKLGKLLNATTPDSNTNMRQLSTSALYISTMNLCSLPRIDVNTKLVVIGTSVTGMSFLESLLFSTSDQYHAIFNNVILVAPCNETKPRRPTKVRSYFFVTTSIYDYEHLHQLSFKTYVNFVGGVMTQIDRNLKTITVDDERKISYDLLFLFGGMQFGKPKLSIVKTLSLKEQRKYAKQDMPKNVLIVNTDRDALTTLTRLKDWAKIHEKYTIIVYGRCLEAFCCIAALMELGIKGPEITMVEPPKKTKEFFTFHSGEIDELMQETLKSEGIVVYSNFRLLDYIWDVDFRSNRLITGAKFESSNKILDLECSVFFSYGNRCFSSRTFLALQKCGLVFDGGLVINNDCTTHDKSIYAAGTLTKFSRRYYADHLYHRYFSSAEVGWCLGTQIRELLIPNYDENQGDAITFQCQQKPTVALVSRYNKPLVSYCNLPGQLHYLHVSKPGAPIPEEVAMTDEDYGTVVITGDCKNIDRQGYFRLHLNQFDCIETITCISKTEIDVHNLTHLFGKHEKLLNNLILHFEMTFISDFFEWFREPWVAAIYSGEYGKFEEKVNTALMTLKDDRGSLLSEAVLKMFESKDFQALTPDERKEVEEMYGDADYEHVIENTLLTFIGKNLQNLNMYAHPCVERTILQGYEESPLFREP